jgi:Na+/H+ antiporter NhaC
MALVTRQVLVSLILGIWLGGVLVAGPDLFSGTLRALDTTIVGVVADSDHVKVLLFTLFLGGMVGVMNRSGGTLGIVQRLVRRATTPRRGALSAWFLGLVVFFDDYANTVIIGPTLRPITDKLRISREKLAYFVDSTAAPVASIAIISTWIGTEVGLIGDALRDVGSDLDPYKVFLETLPYRFYPILALMFGFLVAVMGRDWGPMAKAETRARTGEVLRSGSQPLSDFEGEGLRPKSGITYRARNAVLPIAAVVIATLAGLWWTGAPGAGSPSIFDLFRHPRPLRLLGDVFGSADSYTALLWASALGGLVALFLSLGKNKLNLSEGTAAWIGGVRSMLLAAMILVLAWSLGDVCRAIGTSPYLVGLLSRHLDPHYLPLLIFLVAGAVSFATGTSWGTMAILVPMTVPLAMETCRLHGLDPGPSHRILLGSVSSILAGAVWGDHCSPISDTTVLSSMATSCDHMDHVRTQLPYALIVGVVGILLGDLASAFGLSPWLSILLGIVVLALFLRFAGRPARAPSTT